MENKINSFFILYFFCIEYDHDIIHGRILSKAIANKQWKKVYTVLPMKDTYFIIYIGELPNYAVIWILWNNPAISCLCLYDD